MPGEVGREASGDDAVARGKSRDTVQRWSPGKGAVNGVEGYQRRRKILD